VPSSKLSSSSWLVKNTHGDCTSFTLTNPYFPGQIRGSVEQIYNAEFTAFKCSIDRVQGFSQMQPNRQWAVPITGLMTRHGPDRYLTILEALDIVQDYEGFT
jgi:hypothetical protein